MKPLSARHGWAALGVALLLYVIAAKAVGAGGPLPLAAAAIQLAFVVAAIGVVVAGRLRTDEALSLRAPYAAEVGLALLGTVALHLILRSLDPVLMDGLRQFGWDSTAELERFEKYILAELARNPVAVVLTVAALPALCEETLFRGVILNGLNRSHGPAAALLLSSVLFAMVHLAPARIVMTFVLGLWFGIAAQRSLWPAIAAHAANNVLALLLPKTLPAPGLTALLALPVLAGTLVLFRRRYARGSVSGLAEYKSGDGGNGAGSV